MADRCSTVTRAAAGAVAGRWIAALAAAGARQVRAL